MIVSTPSNLPLTFENRMIAQVGAHSYPIGVLPSKIRVAPIRGLRRFLSNPERNCNVGSLEPWNLMLGCKAGLIFIIFGKFTIYLWLYVTPVPSPWHVPLKMKITYTFHWPIPHVHLLWAMHLPVAGPWDILGSKEANRMTIFSQNSPFNSFCLADFCPCCFFLLSDVSEFSKLGLYIWYNQSQRSWGKGRREEISCFHRWYVEVIFILSLQNLCELSKASHELAIGLACACEAARNCSDTTRIQPDTVSLQADSSPIIPK